MRTLALAAAVLISYAYPTASNIQAQTTAATAIVAGQVIDATTKRPIGGAVVTLTASASPAPAGGAQPAAPAAPTAPTTPARRSVAVANAEGRFVFRDVPAGSYSLTSTRNGYAPGATGRRRPNGPSRTFTIDDGARVTDAVINMWRLASISGIVRDDRGEPAVGVAVWAMRRALTNGRLDLTFTGGAVESTDDRGRYRLSGLMPGSYIVMIRTNLKSAAASTVDAYRAAAMSGATSTFTNEWGQTGALAVTQGIVIDGWQVVIAGEGMSQPLPGPNGTLLINPTTFHGNTRSPAEATVVAIAAADDRTGVDITLPLVAGVRLSGVLNGPSGPAANHGVRLFAATSDPAYEIPVAYGITDASGRFALLGIAPGSYVVRAYRVPQTAPQMRVTPPVPGAPTGGRVEIVPPPAGPPAPGLFAEASVSVGSTHVDGLSLTLQPGARLTGRVAFDGATPPPPAAQMQRIMVSVRPLLGTVTGADARLDAAGAFETARYPPGRYMFNVAPPGPEWTLASVRVGGVDAVDQAFTLGTTDVADVVVTFTDKVITLTGTVRPADATLDVDATVVAFPVDVRAWMAAGMSPRRVATATTSASGTYQLAIPLAGDYLVVALPADIAPDVDPDFVARFASAAVRVSFAAGEAKTQALTVRRPR